MVTLSVREIAGRCLGLGSSSSLDLRGDLLARLDTAPGRSSLRAQLEELERRFCGDDAAPNWEAAARHDFWLRPQAAAEHCVADARAALENINFGRDRGENFYSRGVGRADKGLSSHMQGVARLPGGWLLQSYTEGVFLTHFPARDGAGHEPWVTRPEGQETIFPDLPDLCRDHVGGVHAYDNIVVIPSDGCGERHVEIFWHDHGRLDPLSRFRVSEHQGAAHYASILPLAGGDWLLAVGQDSRKWRKAHRIHFYVIPSLTAAQHELRYLGRWGRGRTRDDFQSASLIADCGGDVFIVGTGVRVAWFNAHAKLYRLLSFTRSDGKRPDVEVEKVKERAPKSQHHDCNLNAGATFFPTHDRGLAMYCTEKEIHDGAITTREYRNE